MTAGLPREREPSFFLESIPVRCEMCQRHEARFRLMVDPSPQMPTTMIARFCTVCAKLALHQYQTGQRTWRVLDDDVSSENDVAERAR